MANPWFRLYHEFATDPKVQMLSEADQRRFIMLLCLRCCNGDETLHDAEVAFQLRISVDEYATTKATLMAKKLIDKDNKPVAWSERQFDSDSSTPRVKAYRDRKKAERNGDETLQKQQGSAEGTKRNVIDTEADTDSDSETYTEVKDRAAGAAPEKKSGKSKLDYSVWPEQPSPQVLTDWLAMRKRQKADVSQTVINQFGKELVAAAAFGHSVDDCLSRCVARGWRGFEAAWLRNGDSRAGPGSGGKRHNEFENRDYTAGITSDGAF
jgi:hypothetical protein